MAASHQGPPQLQPSAPGAGAGGLCSRRAAAGHSRPPPRVRSCHASSPGSARNTLKYLPFRLFQISSVHFPSVWRKPAGAKLPAHLPSGLEHCILAILGREGEPCKEKKWLDSVKPGWGGDVRAAALTLAARRHPTKPAARAASPVPAACCQLLEGHERVTAN